MDDFESAGGQARVALGEHAFHPDEERPFDLVLAVGAHRLAVRGQRRGEHRRHLLVIDRVDVFVDGIAGQFHLREAEVRRGGLGDVHDLAIGTDHEEEAVEDLANEMFRDMSA